MVDGFADDNGAAQVQASPTHFTVLGYTMRFQSVIFSLEFWISIDIL